MSAEQGRPEGGAAAAAGTALPPGVAPHSQDEDALDIEEVDLIALSRLPSWAGGDLRSHPAATAVANYLSREVGFSLPRAEALVERISTMSFTEYGQAFRRNEPVVPSLESVVRPMIEYLKTIPGVNLPRVISNSPFLINTAPAQQALMPSVAAQLVAELGLSGDELGRIINSNAYVLRRPLAATVLPALGVLRALGLTPGEVRRSVMRHPRVLAYRQDRLEHGVATLREVGLSDRQVRSVVLLTSANLGLRRGRVMEAVAWLRRCGVPAHSVPAVVARSPQLLGFSFSANLDPTLAFLKKEAGLGDAAVVKMFINTPSLMGYSVCRLRGNLKAMRAAGLDDDQIERMLNAYPGALRYDFSAPRYAAKLHFLQETLGQDVGDVLATHPMYLTYGLKRIAARAAYLTSLGRPTSSVTGWLSASDAAFVSQRTRRGTEEWLAFKQNWAAKDGSDAGGVKLKDAAPA